MVMYDARSQADLWEGETAWERGYIHMQVIMIHN